VVGDDLRCWIIFVCWVFFLDNVLEGLLRDR